MLDDLNSLKLADESDFESLTSLGEIVDCNLGEVLIQEGTEIRQVFMLLEGRVRLFQTRNNEEQTVLIITEPNQWIGLEGLCLDEPAFSSARVSSASRLLRVEAEKMHEYLAQNAETQRRLKDAALKLKKRSDSMKPLVQAPEKEKSYPAPSLKPVQQEAPQELDERNLRSVVRRKFKLYPLVLQQTAMDCGISCLAMVMQHHGTSASLKKLRELAGVTSQGTDLWSLSEAAEKLGFLTRGLRATYEGLLRARLPLICHWDNNHYVVLYEIDKDGALIADPANDLTTVSREEFTRHFSMYALELVPSALLAKPEKDQPAFSRYASLLLSCRKGLIDIAIASIVVQVLSLATPLFTQLVVDRVLVHKSISMLNIILMGMIILVLFQTMLSWIRSYLVIFNAIKLDQSLFTQFFKHILSLPLSFFEEHTTGDIISRLQENRKIQAFISGSALTTGVDLVMAVIYLALVFYYSWTFGVYVIGYVAVFSLIIFGSTPWLRDLMRKVFHKHVASNSFSIEAIRGIERIKSAAAENRTRWAWEELFVDALNTRYKSALVSRFTQSVSDLVSLLGNILLLWFGAHLVIQNQLTIGQLMALTMLVGRITQPVLFLVDIWDDIQDLRVSFERINEVLDTPAEEEDQAQKISVKAEGNIELSNVTFRYPGNSQTNALQNLNFKIIAGQTVGIVGRSGCGKTTLLKLLQGLYIPTEGQILFEGHDIRHLSLRDLRRQLGVVSQQDYIFRGTIFDTIAFYNPEATNEEVIEAAKLAGIHEFINTLPKSYQYEVWEGGINLSGGQRQRLCIARALVHNPNIILFDEATSFLDYDSERALQQSIQRLRKGKTLVVVAHRLSTIKDCDVILVLDRGEIVERGTHSELLEKRGVYYHLWSQASTT